MIDPGHVEAVCFDLDDTLFEFTQYVRAGLDAAADRLEERTGAALHDELHDLYFEAGVTDGTFDRLVERHDLDPALVPELVSAYHGNEGSLAPYPEAEPVLARLGTRYRLGLLTDGRNGRPKLARLGLEGRFDAIVVAHAEAFGKPDVEAFERIADRLGVAPGSIVYVGDHPRLDVLGARRSGMVPVRVRRGRFADEPSHPDAEPVLEIADLTGLVDWLRVEA